MKRLRFSALLLAAVAAVAVSLTIASPASARNTVLPIQNYGDGMCLQPEGGSQALGAAIVQEPCNNTFAQDWEFIPLGGNSYRLRNQISLLCLDARGGAANGTPVQQWTCGSISNETWDTGRPIPDIVTLTSKVSGTHSHCLDVPGAQPIEGLAMQIYGCNGTVAQAWLVGVGVVVQQ